jgi:hypothetical protein
LDWVKEQEERRERRQRVLLETNDGGLFPRTTLVD